MAEFFTSNWHWPVWLAQSVAALVACVLILNIVAVGALIFIWMERKISGRIQDRLGPTRVGGRFGWLQTLADGVKLIAKEDVTPAAADQMLFKLAPYVSFAASFSAFLALPFANGWVGQPLNSAVFFVLAVLGLEVFGVILAGYASGSKWSLFGAMREAAQVVSYEVPLGLCVVIPVLICGTMNLVTIGNMQSGMFWNWLVFHDPFTFLVFWIYFTCATASVNRAPFDLAEAESELVAGFHTEYSGLRWSFFFMAEYGSMFLVSALAAILFFGGWHGPFPVGAPIASGIAATLQFLSFGFLAEGTAAWLSGYFANLFGCVNLIAKATLGVTVMMWVRWTLPRLRIDQVMTTCLKYCVPLSAVCFVGVVLWQMAVPDGLYGNRLGEFREHWVEEPASQASPDANEKTGERAAAAAAKKPPQNGPESVSLAGGEASPRPGGPEFDPPDGSLQLAVKGGAQ